MEEIKYSEYKDPQSGMVSEPVAEGVVANNVAARHESWGDWTPDGLNKILARSEQDVKEGRLHSQEEVEQLMLQRIF